MGLGGLWKILVLVAGDLVVGLWRDIVTSLLGVSGVLCFLGCNFWRMFCCFWSPHWFLLDPTANAYVIVCVFVWSLALRMGAASVGGVVASQRALGHACRVGVGFDICSQLLPKPCKCVFLRVSSSWGEKECNEQRFRC